MILLAVRRAGSAVKGCARKEAGKRYRKDMVGLPEDERDATAALGEFASDVSSNGSLNSNGPQLRVSQLE